MVAMGLLTAEFIQAAKHKTAQVVFPPVLRLRLNMHTPHVDFHDAVLVLPLDDDRRARRPIAQTPKMLNLSSSHDGSIGFTRHAGKPATCSGPRVRKYVERMGR